MPLLQLTLGDWFRLDRLDGINGRIHNAFTVVSWNLADTGPQYDGFCCVPGSHKSNFVRPNPIPTVNQGRWKMMEGDSLAPGVVIPEAPAGPWCCSPRR